MWVKGAGWTDLCQPMTQNGKNNQTEYLTEKLKELIEKYVDCGRNSRRAVRAQVPRPSKLSGAKSLPDLGDTLGDAIELRDKMLAEEQK